MRLLTFPTLHGFSKGSNSPLRSKVHRLIILLWRLFILAVAISLWIPSHVPKGWELEALLPLIKLVLLFTLPNLGEVIPMFILFKT